MAWTSRKANITAACVTLLVFLLAIFMLLAQIDVNSPSLRLVRIDRTRSPSYHHHISTEDSRHELSTSGADMPSIDGLSFDSQGANIRRRLHYWNWIKRPLAPGPISDHHRDRDVSVSAFHSRQYNRYITVEFFSGFNNLRMQLETIFVLAHILNRTLVLPPRHVISHNERPSLIEDFWDLGDMRKAVRVLTWREYADEAGVPYSEIDDVSKFSKHFELKAAPINMLPNWDPLNDVLVVPSIRACKEQGNYAEFKFPSLREFATKDRVHRFIQLNSSHFSASHLHFMTRFDRDPPVRLFGLYYTFIYFADVRWHSYYVQLVRKYLHYRSEIANAASLVIANILRENPLSPGFVSLHIRRGDFSVGYTSVMQPIDAVVREYGPLFDRDQPSPLGTMQLRGADSFLYGKVPIYLSTDESNYSYFAPLRSGYRVYERSQLRAVLELARLLLANNTANKHLMWVMENPDMVGPIEQIVCMGGRSFLGTLYSTYTSYIHRLRAHYPVDLALAPRNLSQDIPYDRKFYFQHLPYLPEDGNLTLMSWAAPGAWDPVDHGRPDAIWGREFAQGLYPLDY